jgi:hypothetical protein
MTRRNIYFLICVLFLGGCSSAPSYQGHFGYEDSRRVVIVGENVNPAIAMYYQRKYNSPVWFTPFEGHVASATRTLLKTPLAPSPAMRSLIKELKSINGSVGRWEIIVPKSAEKYFYKTLRHMPSNSLAKTRGLIVLIDSTGFKRLEEEVNRVSNGNLFVTYEFHKDLADDGDF